MEREIQALGFFVLCDSETDNPVEYFQDDGADDAGIEYGCADAKQLHGHLTADTAYVTAKTGTAQAFGAEHTG